MSDDFNAPKTVNREELIEYLRREVRIVAKQRDEAWQEPMKLHFGGVICGYEIIVGKLVEGWFE